MIGKYIRVILTGKYGVVNGSFFLDTITGKQEFFWIVLNDFNTTVATCDELEIIY
jgi:hypothetical protein